MTETSERALKGLQTMREVLCSPLPALDTPLMQLARDFIMADVWSRPGLDRRSRRFITLACVCAAPSPIAIRAYMIAALESGDITLEELHEFMLQFAAYQGFPKAIAAETILNALRQERDSKGA